MTKPVASERAVRREHRGKQRGFGTSGRCRRSWRFNIAGEMAKKTTRQGLKAAKKGKAARRVKASRSASGAKARTPRPLHGDVKPLDAGRGRGGVPPLPGRQSGAEGRTPARQSLHAAGRRRAVGAGDRCRRQQGDARSVRRRRHAGEDGGARRGQGARLHQDHRALPQQGEERHRAVAEADRRAWRRGAAHARGAGGACPASGARPRMSCSTWRSASRPWRSIRMSSASATAPGLRPARIRSRSS